MRIDSIKQNKLIKGVAGWMKTIYFPIVYALLGVMASTMGYLVYIPVFCLYALTAVFATLFCDDLKVFVTMLIYTYFALGCDGTPSLSVATNNFMDYFARPSYLYVMIACYIVIGLCFVVRLATDGHIRNIFTKGNCSLSLLLIAAAFVTNGIFSSKWTSMNLLYGLQVSSVLLGGYSLLTALRKGTEDFFPYFKKVLAVLACMVTLEVVLLFVKVGLAGKLIVVNSNGAVDWSRDYLTFSWGVSNLLGAFLVLLMPAIFLWAHGGKGSLIAMFVTVLMYICVLLLRGRTSMLSGAMVLIAGNVICCTGGNNKKSNRIFALSILSMIVLTIVVTALTTDKLTDVYSKLMSFLRFDQSDSGRLALWKDGLKDFLSAPLFGVGFSDGGLENPLNNMYSNMYHNIVVQLLGATGLIGSIAFVIHLIELSKLTFTKSSSVKTLCLVAVISVIVGSMLDNFFYYPGIQMLYCTFVVMSESLHELPEKEQTVTA